MMINTAINSTLDFYPATWLDLELFLGRHLPQSPIYMEAQQLRPKRTSDMEMG